MKLTIMLIFVFNFQLLASNVYSQGKVTLNLPSANFKQVISEIEKKTSYRFVFSERKIPAGKYTDLNVVNREVPGLIKQLLDGTSFTYQQLPNNLIAIVPVGVSDKDIANLADVEVTGTVTTKNSEPIPGVSVAVVGSAKGTQTDALGNFKLSVPVNSTLRFSFVGYVSKDVKVSAENNKLSIQLLENEKELNEVVVVGYGTQRKRDITGSTSSISKESLKDLVLTSTEQAVRGQAAGVHMTPSSSAPGGNASVRIRGGNSISAGNEPLYVVDGFPIYNDTRASSTGVLGNGQPSNVLASINPSDIESMEILKDASATAIYGSRGANGVILITTKRGKSGQANINFDAYYGVQKLSKKIDVLNAYDYALAVNADNVRRGRQPYIANPELFNPAVYGQGTDWQNEAFRTAPTRSYSLSLSGGDDKTKYAVSGNYFTQDGILLGSDFERGSVRVNLDRNLTAKLKLGLSFSSSQTKNNQARTDTDLDNNNIGAVTSVLYAPPTQAVYAADGSYNRFRAADNNFYVNPIASLLEIKNLSKNNRTLGNVFLDYKITNDLVLKVSFGADQINVKEEYYNPASIQDAGITAKARIGNIQSFNWLNENTLTYTKTFATKHNFTALVGYTRQRLTSESVTAGSEKFITDILQDNSLGNGAIVNSPSSGVSQWSLESYLARINYAYDNKYLLTLTGRSDGSSRFGEGKKYALFPSGSVAWRVSEEEFMKTQRVISNLKLRMSYGATGNNEIPQYRSLAALGSANYPIGGTITNGLAPSRVPNPDLRWETTTQFDAGIDLSLFSDRISIVADYYNKRTKDLLLDVLIAGNTGYQTSLQNIGSAQNRGVELALNTVNFDSDFKWRSSFNITFNKNKVLDLGGDVERPSGGGSSSKQITTTGILRVGEPVGIFYGYVTDGLFQTPAEVTAGIAAGQAGVQLGDRRFKDVNGDGKFTAADRTILGYAQPKFFYGFSNTFAYKNVDLNVLINGVRGNSVLNLNINAETDVNAPDSKNRWTPTNTNTDVPRSTITTTLTNKQIEDGSYLRIQNISLGYNLPAQILKKTFVSSLRVYTSLQNYFTFTKYKGYNPDVSSFGQDNLSIGVDRGAYPAAKTFLIGLNARF
jgi:TonB-linked SusC/RagA family outer membrane protein